MRNEIWVFGTTVYIYSMYIYLITGDRVSMARPRKRMAWKEIRVRITLGRLDSIYFWALIANIEIHRIEIFCNWKSRSLLSTPFCRFLYSYVRSLLHTSQITVTATERYCKVHAWWNQSGSSLLYVCTGELLTVKTEQEKQNRAGMRCLSQLLFDFATRQRFTKIGGVAMSRWDNVYGESTGLVQLAEEKVEREW